MSASAIADAEAPDARHGAEAPARRFVDHIQAAAAALGAAIIGAAPHVLHHVGPLAGAALLAGATGKLLFGALGFLLALPMLRRLRRRHGSWAVPGGLLALMAVAFTFSTFVIGPAISDSGSESAKNVPAAPSGTSRSEHESHHRQERGGSP